MRALVTGKTLRCEFDGEQTHDGHAGVCHLEGKDISAVMVASCANRLTRAFRSGRELRGAAHVNSDDEQATRLGNVRA
jgi:hypothetical protein